MMVYDKAVRDKIPEIILAEGKKVVLKPCDSKEFEYYLKKNLWIL